MKTVVIKLSVVAMVLAAILTSLHTAIGAG
jgi:hypothetical protein